LKEKSMIATKIKLAAVSVGSSVMLLAPVSASAHSWDWHGHQKHGHTDRIAAKCERLNNKLSSAQASYDLTDKSSRRHWQHTLNKANNHDCQTHGTIVDFLAGSPQFSTLVTAVQAAGLAETLSGGEFTVFAPTNAAFAALPAGTLDTVLADKALLTDILTYHAVAGSVDAATAKTLTTATMVNGKSVSIKSEGRKLYINDSRVVLYDVRTSNGIVHVIDSVLLP
jgi:uncharacterized surface protein with fasciclin (FAS1) repeats